jgi:hypothetical protein
MLDFISILPEVKVRGFAPEPHQGFVLPHKKADGLWTPQNILSLTGDSFVLENVGKRVLAGDRMDSDVKHVYI